MDVTNPVSNLLETPEVESGAKRKQTAFVLVSALLSSLAVARAQAKVCKDSPDHPMIDAYRAGVDAFRASLATLLPKGSTFTADGFRSIRGLGKFEGFTFPVDIGLSKPVQYSPGIIAEMLIGMRTTSRVRSIHLNDKQAQTAITARETKASKGK